MSERVQIGRYMLGELLGAGGMARVYLGRAIGDAGFSRPVAIKRLHPELVADRASVEMLLDEALLGARIRHPNVAAAIDIVRADGEFLLVMEYAEGVSLSTLLRIGRTTNKPPSTEIVAAIFSNVLRGLHAAHEAKDAKGEPLRLVHRDVSPQNVLVCDDGLARVLDFGIATAASRLHRTETGALKGKPAYMAPEQLLQGPTDRRTDVFAAGVMLWETITGDRPFQVTTFEDAARHAMTLAPIASEVSRSPSALLFSPITTRAMSPDAESRFQTAEEMAIAIEEACELATPGQVSSWARDVAAELFTRHRRLVAELDAAIPAKHEPALSPAEHAVTEASEPEDVPRWRRWIGIAAGLCGVVALASVIGWRVVHGPTSRAPAPIVATTSAEPSASMADVAPAAAPPLDPAPPTASEDPPRRRTSSSPPRASKTPRPDCRTPYTIDASGTRIPRRECL